MTTFNISLFVYCWVLFLIYLWARKNEPALPFLVSLVIAVIVAVIFYAPLILIWALKLFSLLV